MAATNKCLAHFNKSGMQAKATKKCVADITATDLARPPPHHALAALEDRSMSEESNKQCSICFRRYTEFGHPAEPVKSGRCCNACNDLVVIPARLRAMREATVAPPALTAVSEATVVPPALTAVSEDHKVVCSATSPLQTSQLSPECEVAHTLLKKYRAGLAWVRADSQGIGDGSRRRTRHL
jgi:hypothetical protein